MDGLTRRRVLAAGGVAAVGVLAGCTSSAEEDDESKSERDGTVLSDITVENLAGDAHTVDVIVEFDGDIEHWSTHHVDGETTSAELESEWPSGAGSFRVLARLDADQLIEVKPGKWNDPACLSLLVTIERSGELRLYSDTQGGSCSSASGAPTDT